MKIVTGGQTGVDRAALDAARESRVAAGGWCPEGRLSEDGRIPDAYPVNELVNAGYKERTRQNVIDSDGTAVIYFCNPTGGTKQTIDFCIQEQKPYALIDAEVLTVEQAINKIQKFIGLYTISILNVAGPRTSEEPAAYAYARKTIKGVLHAHIA